MDATTRKRLEAAGWRTGTVAELLGLTPAESAFIEMKLALARTVRTLRERRHLSQDQAAAALGSSQSRISKIEAADRSVSLDLLVRFALDLGATRRDVAETLLGSSVSVKRVPAKRDPAGRRPDRSRPPTVRAAKARTIAPRRLRA